MRNNALLCLFLILVVTSLLLTSTTASAPSLSRHTLDSCTTDACALYLRDRAKYVAQDQRQSFDSDVILTAEEILVDSYLTQLRLGEYKTMKNNFPPAMNFRTAREIIDRDSVKLFPILKSMPKGGIHHIHSLAEVRQLIQVATYRSDCYMNVGTGSNRYPPKVFFYSLQVPEDSKPSVEWKSTVELRSLRNASEFDEELYQLLQFYTPDNSTNDDDMWDYFDLTLLRLDTLISYVPVFNATMLHGFELLVKDNVQYVELRGINTLYDRDPLTNELISLSLNETVLIVKDLVKLFATMTGSFFDMRYIFISIRRGDSDRVFSEMVEAVKLIDSHPDFILGYDLVDEEIRYNPLFYYLDDFFKIKEFIQTNGYKDLVFAFHAGETNRFYSNNSNLYDAILLNTTRIGHGYELRNHPFLIEVIKSKNIAIEICPISNQLLRISPNIQSHMAVELLNNNVQITISPDDPVIYGYSGVSYDYYEAFIAWRLSLKGLKKLAQNTIVFSLLQTEEKQKHMQYWEQQWKKWITTVHASISRG